jgi:hypothetical protein
MGDFPKRQLLSITPGRVERLYSSPPAPAGGVIQTNRSQIGMSDSTWIATAIGLKPFSKRHGLWLNTIQIARMTIKKVQQDQFDLLQTGNAGYLYRWRFIMKPSLELVSFDWYLDLPSGHYIHCATLRCSEFHSVQGIQLPQKIVEIEGPGSHGGPFGKIVLTHLEYIMNSSSNTPNSYYIVFPKGAFVMDQRIHHGFYIHEPTTLMDKIEYKLLAKHDAILTK